MANLSHWLQFPTILWIFAVTVFSREISVEAMKINDECRNSSSCAAQAVHDELMKAIELVKANTFTEHDATFSSSPQLRKFQEDEDYGNDPLLEFPSVVPNVFKLINSALSLNSSGLVEGSFGLLPPNLSNRVTNVLGLLATSILGPGTTTPRPRRRRRTTTTAATTTQETTTTEDATTTIATSTEPSTMPSFSPELRVNGTSDVDSGNSTEITDEIVPETTEVLFKESALGELPVYAAAYAPNYVAATTPYPVYASQFLHALYSAPTTPTIPTTTTTATTTASTSTSTDPNSYAIALPFDYMEGGIGAGSGPVFNESSNFINTNMPPNVTFLPPLQVTPPEYMEYEYEEQTEEAVARLKDGKFAKSQDHLSSALPVNPRNVGLMEADQREEKVGKVDNVKTNSSSDRISRLLFFRK